MGLDSLDLLMEVEKYFQISITAPEAEQVFTIQDLVNLVAKNLGVVSEEKHCSMASSSK